MNNKSLRPLAVTFAISGLWDTVAGVMYIFSIGIGRKIDNPTIDPFFSIVLGSFFLCFAYLQFFSELNIKRYAFTIGCLIFGRAFYIILLFIYMGLSMMIFRQHFGLPALLTALFIPSISFLLFKVA